ncbi:putative acetyltransferase [Chitinophaga skermanii]|uniref:Putative acetyltransferase n=1 Tax=Chitinophaga skermanii TaxID=331697 RepID=A0A327QE24_9BACT|nr:GNAT family N-acetyltransferase [Chitinophaga skermanii]RAJ02561.1 putative acetyltransferase [Chitinophaga skermanii]
MYIRKATLKDTNAIIALCVSTIDQVNAKDYNEAQRQAWTKSISVLDKMEKRIGKQFFFVAEVEQEMAGLGSIDSNGEIDLLYVSAAHQTQGIGKALYTKLHDIARKLMLKELTSNVSITAKPFFEKLGFEVVAEQVVDLKGTTLNNYKMRRSMK